jgi:hypothetical protein
MGVADSIYNATFTLADFLIAAAITLVLEAAIPVLMSDLKSAALGL